MFSSPLEERFCVQRRPNLIAMVSAQAGLLPPTLNQETKQGRKDEFPCQMGEFIFNHSSQCDMNIAHREGHWQQQPVLAKQSPYPQSQKRGG